MSDSSAHNLAWRSFLAPRFWPTWLGFAVLWLISRLPYDSQLWLGRQLGKLSWHALPSRRRVTMTNLDIAFPEQTPEARELMAREVYAHVGMSIAEGASLWFRPISFYTERFELLGTDYMEEALSLKRGVILLQAHFSLLEMNATVIEPAVCRVPDQPTRTFHARADRQ